MARPAAPPNTPTAPTFLTRLRYDPPRSVIVPSRPPKEGSRPIVIWPTAKAGQSLLDAGGLAGLALVHQAVGEGVLPCRPGLCGEIEQHGPGDDAVVVVAE